MTHPLSPFRFCPICGGQSFIENNVKSMRCRNCGFVYYANPSSATAAFIVRGDQLLVARRGKEPAKGTLDLPGGFVDMYETAEQGMARELMEETGLQALNMQYLFSIPNIYRYSGMDIHTLDMFFLVDVASDAEPRADDDAASLQWIPISDLAPSLFGLHSISQAVARFCTEKSTFLPHLQGKDE